MTKIKDDKKSSVLGEVNTTSNTKIKRGRKSKKEIQAILDNKLNNMSLQDNIVCTSQEDKFTNISNEMDVLYETYQLSSSKFCENDDDNKNENENENDNDNENDNENENNNENDNQKNASISLSNDNVVLGDSQKIVSKKRGRKPKGGKIIQQIVPSSNNKEVKPNVILHLKCSLKELQLNSINSCVESFNFSSSKNELNYEIINMESNSSINNNYTNENNSTLIASQINDEEYQYDNNDYDESYSNKEMEIKDVWKKLKTLENNLHINNISDKKSACFWCTFEFDNPPVYIPKHYIKETYSVYGCFCSPECATAHLMEENIDSSAKFERYYLLNHIYSKIYNYDKNIKPAPNPFYMLDKYYGNLSIQEYRALLRNERLFLIVDKPLTRILPELHEDNDDFIINNKIIPTNKYQIKKKIQKKSQNKNNILNEKFGMN